MVIIETNFRFFRKLLTVLFILLCLPGNAFSDTQSPTNADSLVQTIGASSKPCEEVKQYANREQKHAIKPLINILKSQKEKKVQICIAEALAQIDVDESVDILIKSLNDENLLAASRSAFALGIIKDSRAVDHLLKALLESNIPCPAAQALGMIKDPDMFESLNKAVYHKDSSIRGCAIQGLVFYGDSCVCETLTDVFMTDSDQGVQFMARSAKEALNCPSVDKKSSKYAINDDYCSLGQRLIDIATPLLESTHGLKEWQTREWQKSPEWINGTSEIFAKYKSLSSEMTPTEEKELMMLYSIS